MTTVACPCQSSLRGDRLRLGLVVGTDVGRWIARVASPVAVLDAGKQRRVDDGPELGDREGLGRLERIARRANATMEANSGSDTKLGVSM